MNLTGIFSVFAEALEGIVTVLKNLESGLDERTTGDEKEKSPSSLHRALCNFRFIVPAVILERCMSVTYSLFKILQSVQIDLFSAMEQ